MADQNPNEAVHMTPIHSLALNLYSHPTSTFINTVLIESFKLVSKKHQPTMVLHPYPFNTFMEYPFVVINGTFVRGKQETLRLLTMLVQFSWNGARGDGGFKVPLTRVLGAVRLAGQLCDVAYWSNEEQDHNPYYMFLNPINKLRYYLHTNTQKQQLASSNYLSHSNKINKDQFLYKLTVLSNYFAEVLAKTQQKQPLSLIFQIILMAFLKHIRKNNRNLSQVISLDNFLKLKSDRTLSTLEKISQIEVELEQRDDGLLQVPIYGFYEMDILPKKQKKEEEEYELLHEKITRHLVKPIALTCFVLAFKHFTSTIIHQKFQ